MEIMVAGAELECIKKIFSAFKKKLEYKDTGEVEIDESDKDFINQYFSMFTDTLDYKYATDMMGDTPIRKYIEDHASDVVIMSANMYSGDQDKYPEHMEIIANHSILIGCGIDDESVTNLDEMEFMEYLLNTYGKIPIMAISILI